MRVKLLHCGDLHLDAPLTSLAGREGLPDKRRQELKKALGTIVDLAIAEQVDLLLICGDLYEHGYLKKSTFHFLCDQLARIGGIPVLVIPGNHDPDGVDSFYCGYEWPENVHILNRDNPCFEHAATGTRVYGWLPGNNSASASSNLSENGDSPVTSDRSFPPVNGGLTVQDDRIHILMLHGTLDMPFSTDPFHPVSSGELELLGFDYYALGHFHSVIRGAGKSKRIYNAGSPEPLGFDEEGEHGVFLVTLEKQQGGQCSLDAEFRRIAQRRYINMEVQVGECLTDEQAAAAVASAMEKAGDTKDLYRIYLKGYVNPGYRADPAYIAELLVVKAGYSGILDTTEPEYDFGSIAKEPGLKGLFVRKMLDRAEAAPDAEAKQLVMKALYYGLEAIDGGSVCV